MQNLKTVGIAVLVALTVLGVGYLWGARGRWAAEERLQGVERQAAFSEARRLTLAGQMSLTRLNFGEAAGLFESARVAAEEIARGLDQDGQIELAGEATKAAQTLADARALAAKLDQGAAGKGGEALAILDAAATTPGPAR
jgi:hypothetical protein